MNSLRVKNTRRPETPEPLTEEQLQRAQELIFSDEDRFQEIFEGFRGCALTPAREAAARAHLQAMVDQALERGMMHRLVQAEVVMRSSGHSLSGYVQLHRREAQA